MDETTRDIQKHRIWEETHCMNNNRRDDSKIIMDHRNIKGNAIELDSEIVKTSLNEIGMKLKMASLKSWTYPMQKTEGNKNILQFKF